MFILLIYILTYCRALEFLESFKESSRSVVETGVGPLSSGRRSRRSDRSGASTPQRRSSKPDLSSYSNMKIEDFQLMKVLGVGGFGRVRLVKFIPTGDFFVLKSQSKEVS